MKQIDEAYGEYENKTDDLGTIKLTYRIFKNEKN